MEISIKELRRALEQIDPRRYVERSSSNFAWQVSKRVEELVKENRTNDAEEIKKIEGQIESLKSMIHRIKN